MKNLRFLKIFFAVILLLPSVLGAMDFGVLLDQYAAFGSYGEDSSFFEYRAGLVPRVTHYFSEKTSIFAAASITFGYNGGFYLVPELLRTEFSYYSGPLGIKAGRFHYSDPLGIIADSLFDGAQVSYGFNIGRISAGVWYTGFLYKKNARIMMTGKEETSYGADLDYGNFFETYFAPKRLLAAIDWENLSLFDFLQLKASVIAQFDFSGESDKYHSEYLVVSASVPVKSFVFNAGGSFEAVQFTGTADNNYFAFAGELGVTWTLPIKMHSRLSLKGHYASGNISNDFGAFMPLTTTYSGDLIQAKTTGIMYLDMNFSMRISNELGASLNVGYYRRTDVKSKTVSINNNETLDLGIEIFARGVWSPFSDLNVSLGGGLFLPSWKDQKTIWRIDLGAILALY